jgi:hypothetical protein
VEGGWQKPKHVIQKRHVGSYSMRERDSRGKRRAVKAEKGPASGGRGGGRIVNQLK